MTGLLGGLLVMGMSLMMASWLVRGLFGWVFGPRPGHGGWYGLPMMWGGARRGGYGYGRPPMGPRVGCTRHVMGGPGMAGVCRVGGLGYGGPRH